MTRRKAVEGEMEEELWFHLDRQVEKYVATVAAQKSRSTPRKIHERPWTPIKHGGSLSISPVVVHGSQGIRLTDHFSVNAVTENPQPRYANLRWPLTTVLYGQRTSTPIL